MENSSSAKARKKATEEQEQIIAAVASGDNVFVEAGAGCAKSSTLEMAAPRISGVALAVAFNKSIAKELAPRLPPNVVCKTLSALGYGAWRLANPGVSKWELEDRKIGKLVSETAKERKIALSGDQWTLVRGMVEKAMAAGLVPRSSAEGKPGLIEDEDSIWVEIGEELGDGQSAERLVDLARDVLERSIAQARQGRICFDDMVYCPTVLGGVWPRAGTVLVDESQDLSMLNRVMLQHCSPGNARLIVVGDRRQSIYAFRGADSESMDALRGLRPEWARRELSMTFRCPKAVVARQQAHYPGFRAFERNAEGRVVRLGSASEDEGTDARGWLWKDVMGELPAPGASLAVLCRNNGPLFALAFKLLRRGVSVMMIGRDIGKGLEALSRRLAPEDATPADIVRGKVIDWMEEERARLIANGREHLCAGVSDRGECLLAVLENAEVRDAGELRAMLAKLFATDSAPVVLSSIHRAKGLEWDCVVLLDPWRIPSKWAREAAKRGDKREMQQEMNLRYVAETRTKHTLVLADLEGFGGIG